MKHFTFKTVLLLFALVVGSGSVWADTGSLISDLSSIESGETYYIAAYNSSKYYTVPNTTINAQTFTCSEGSINGTTLTPATGAGEFVFTAVSGVSNAYYIYNTNLKKFLVATGSKTFGYVENTSNKYGYWTFSTVSTGGFSGVFSVKHSNKTHYMRAYSNSVKCYDGASNNGIYLFKKQQFTLTYSATNGSIGGKDTNNNTIASGTKIAPSATVTLTATPASGYSFKGWSVEGTGSTLSSTSSNPTTFTMGTANSTVTAVFEESTIVANPTFSVAEGTYNAAQSVTLSCPTDGATIYYTTDGTAPTSSSTEYTGAIDVNETMTIKAIAIKAGLTDSEVASATYTLQCATPEITVPAGAFLDSKVITMTSTDGASIYYTTDGSAPTGLSTLYDPANKPSISATTTIKAIATKSGWSDSEVATETFTKIVPKTVGEAIAATPSSGTLADQYIHGIVSSFQGDDIMDDGSNYRYYISDDGTTTTQLEVYKGKGLNNVAFSDADDLLIGDEVVIFGGLTTFGSTKEIASGNYIVSLVRKPAPTFSVSPSSATLEAYTHETADVTLTTNTDGVITCESSNSDVATVALKSGNVYTITAQTSGTATITIKAAASENYAQASAAVTVTVNDSRADAGISFTKNAEEITWGESFTGQALTNSNSVSVTWSSTNEDVATVDNTGDVTVLKAGTTEIKANFAGNATYKTAVASYTLTVNKANADLSYTTTSFEIMLNDDTFEAPALNNPNNLTGITYASNKTTVATVNSTTGELSYVASAEGTATITATFAGNDWYNAGNASYTITIYDPTVKGSKYNPYTVAEVIAMAPTSTSAPAEGQSDIYVTGYLIGEFRNITATNTTVLTSDFTTDANIALADSPTTTALASSIPVNLTSNNHKNAFGNKTNKGKTIGYKVLVKGDALKYFSVPGLKNIDEISAVSVPATLGTNGYTTFASPLPLDLTAANLPTGVSAYKASVEGTTVTFTEIDQTVPANTGILLKGTANETVAIPVAASGTAVANNAFEVNTAGTTFDGDDDYYYFGLKKNTLTFALFEPSTVAIPANKAYLMVLKSSIPASAKSLNVVFDETTGISTLERIVIDNDAWYDLQGRRVAQPTKGVFIHNGKKIFVK